jgi:DNA-binding transcriptional ArsR family regulator
MMKMHQRARVFTNPVRLRLIRALSQAPEGLTRAQVADAVKMPTTGLSQHFRILLTSRIVRNQKKGRHSIYSLDRNEYQALLERLYQVIASQQSLDDDDPAGA